MTWATTSARTPSPLAAPLLAGALALFSLSGANAAGDGGDKVDLARLSCGDAVHLAQDDPARFAALVQWVAGWRAEPKVVVTYDTKAFQRVGAGWAKACAAAPDKRFTDVADGIPKKELAGDNTTAMAAFKCQNFLDLLKKDKDGAMDVIRWLDGWNASAMNQTTINFYYHKKQLASATDGCMKYPKKGIMYVVAGKYR